MILFAMGVAIADDVANDEVPADPDARPRIGLVLGGGGARGAAHIGVLKELERLRIPVDAIAGTSMGAILGGLYATGLNAEELEKLVESMDWAAALSDALSRKTLSFRRKQDEREFPVDFELGIRDGDLLLPKGVIQGQTLDLLLRELTLDASHITDFDQLPIPLRVIASDIVSGEAVVMSGGDLAKSIRASMSVPAVFAPVRIDGRLLVDGGIVGNLPIDVMKAMGVDIIIAVDVEFPLYDAQALESVLAISEQVLTIMMRKETRRQIATLSASDVLIRPELGTYSSSDFTKIIDTIEPGEKAVQQQSGRLSELSLSESEWRTHLAQRKPRSKEGGKLAFVRVVQDGKLAPQVLESRLDVEAGDEINAAILAQNANRLYGLQLYEQVGYRLVEESGATGVEYHAVPKSWGPNFLQFGVSLEDDFEGSTRFNLAARMTRAGLNKLGAEWRTDVQLGTDPILLTEFYQPLSFDSRVFVAPRLHVRQSNLNAFALDHTIARYRVSEGDFGLDFGREIGTVGEFRTGLYRGVGEARVKVGDPGLANIEFETGGLYTRLRFDTVDNSRFPTEGFLADIVWDMSRPSLGADYSFDTVKGDFSQTWSRGKGSLQLGLNYATTLDSDDTVQDFFPMGGFLRLSGLERGEIAGPHAALVKLVYYRRVGSTTGGVFDTPLYLGTSVEAGNVWQSRDEMAFNTMRLSGSLFAGMDTYFGPVYLAAGYSEGGHTNFYLFIGAPPR
ncbi:MAG: patatin-like phospholipase family protein [Gammaproteobacteria bacterium]|nr:patatin-like phospholipase family protein [Gammaproteobacteria bacterium]